MNNNVTIETYLIEQEVEWFAKYGPTLNINELSTLLKMKNEKSLRNRLARLNREQGVKTELDRVLLQSQIAPTLFRTQPIARYIMGSSEE